MDWETALYCNVTMQESGAKGIAQLWQDLPAKKVRRHKIECKYVVGDQPMSSYEGRIPC